MLSPRTLRSPSTEMRGLGQRQRPYSRPSWSWLFVTTAYYKFRTKLQAKDVLCQRALHCRRLRSKRGRGLGRSIRESCRTGITTIISL